MNENEIFVAALKLSLAGFEGLKAREATIPRRQNVRLHEALEGLTVFSTNWHSAEPSRGYGTKAAGWQTKVDEYKNIAHASETPKSEAAKFEK